MNPMYDNDAPTILLDFLKYRREMKHNSENTLEAYYLDLRFFFRFLLKEKEIVSNTLSFRDIPIHNVDLTLIRSIKRADIYAYRKYLQYKHEIRPDSEPTRRMGMKAASTSRRETSLRSFFDYLYSKAELIDENPMKTVQPIPTRKTKPKHLSQSEAIRLLESVNGSNRERDYCILTLLLNCGLRISELSNLNLSDIQDDCSLFVAGISSVPRTVYINDACIAALNAWLPLRKPGYGEDEDALFVSQKRRRISSDAIQALVKKHLTTSGLANRGFSPESLRHTAAVLMLKGGVDVQTLQLVLGHKSISSTLIYTHADKKSLRIAAQANPLAGMKPPVAEENIKS